MSETKFTKGEWVVSYGNLVNIGGAEWELESVADAHLIAAAPEMYAMLDDLANGRGTNYPIEQLLAKARGE